MKSFPSNLPLVSFYQYSPRGNSALSKRSREIVINMKRDGIVATRTDEGIERVRVLNQMARTLVSRIPEVPFLETILNLRTMLVPVPGHSPLLDPASVWAAKKFCELLGGHHKIAACVELLERVTRVAKSSTAGPGERPSPEDHYRSMRVVERLPLLGFQSITLVDDVVTRGSTMLGAYRRLSEVYECPIRCFALARTMSGEVTSLIDPVEGTICFDAETGTLTRRP